MAGKGGYIPGSGRKPGVPNKLTTDVKTMILAALEGLGGMQYLMDQGRANPTAFMTLVGKVLPMQVTGEGGGPVMVITGVMRAEDEKSEEGQS